MKEWTSDETWNIIEQNKQAKESSVESIRRKEERRNTMDINQKVRTILCHSDMSKQLQEYNGQKRLQMKNCGRKLVRRQ